MSFPTRFFISYYLKFIKGAIGGAQWIYFDVFSTFERPKGKCTERIDPEANVIKGNALNNFT